MTFKHTIKAIHHNLLLLPTLNYSYVGAEVKLTEPVTYLKNTFLISCMQITPPCKDLITLTSKLACSGSHYAEAYGPEMGGEKKKQPKTHIVVRIFKKMAQ